MPILVKDYLWSETSTDIHIQVPLKGVKGSKADVFCGEEFLKVHYPPYLFEALLYRKVDDRRSSAKVRDNCIVLTLAKAEPGAAWGRLLSERSDDKKFVLQKKLEALEAEQRKKEAELEEKRIIKDQDKKYTVKQMLELEQGDRARIEDIKSAERERTTRELAEWKSRKQAEAEEEVERERAEAEERSAAIFTTVDGHQQVDDDGAGSSTDEDITAEEIEEEKRRFLEATAGSRQAEKESTEGGKKEAGFGRREDKKKKSTVRENGSISVTFTPRVFPTPIRESKAREEEEWLEKQALARRTFKVDDPDLQKHEQDPDWLIEKASQLFAADDIQGAVNAYTLAIKIRPHMPLLYSNRAACQIKLRNLYKSMEDSSRALDLMTPKVAENAQLRMKTHVRRATAMCELELYVEALMDYEAALKIEPNNETLLRDSEKIRKVIQSTKDDSDED